MDPSNKSGGRLQQSTLPVQQQMQRIVQALLELGLGSKAQEAIPISRHQCSAHLSRTGTSCKMRHRLISCFPWTRMTLRSYDAFHLAIPNWAFRHMLMVLCPWISYIHHMKYVNEYWAVAIQRVPSTAPGGLQWPLWYNIHIIDCIVQLTVTCCLIIVIISHVKYCI